MLQSRDQTQSRSLNVAISIAALIATASSLLFAYSMLKPKARIVAIADSARSTSTQRATSDYRLSPDGALIKSDQAPLPLATGIAGYVDVLNFEGPNAIIEGWAVDLTRQEPASLIIALVDRISVASVRPSKPRPDVSAIMHQPWALGSGYVIFVPMPPEKTPSRSAVRVFALDASGHARELSYAGNYPFGLR